MEYCGTGAHGRGEAAEFTVRQDGAAPGLPSGAAAPIHMDTSATQAVSEKIAPPLSPAPTAQPPASMAPNPMAMAPAM